MEHPDPQGGHSFRVPNIYVRTDITSDDGLPGMEKDNISLLKCITPAKWYS